jgi:hypothetical protein
MVATIDKNVVIHAAAVKDTVPDRDVVRMVTDIDPAFCVPEGQPVHYGVIYSAEFKGKALQPCAAVCCGQGTDDDFTVAVFPVYDGPFRCPGINWPDPFGVCPRQNVDGVAGPGFLRGLVDGLECGVCGSARVGVLPVRRHVQGPAVDLTCGGHQPHSREKNTTRMHGIFPGSSFVKTCCHCLI